MRSCLADDFLLTRLNRDDIEITSRYRGRRITSRELASTFRADGVPTTVVLSLQVECLLHLSGYVEPAPLRVLLAYLSTRAYREVPYEAFRVDPAGCGRASGMRTSPD